LTRRPRKKKLQPRRTRKKKKGKGVVIWVMLVHRSYNTRRIHLEREHWDITIALYIIDNTWARLITFFLAMLVLGKMEYMGV